MHFDPAYPLIGLRRATYNPRAIADDAMGGLVDSLRRFGIVKPIIVTTGNLIIAGHQRTRAAGILGLTTSPAWVLDEVTEGDEVRFNQLHNGTDLDQIDHPVLVPPSDAKGFSDVSAADIRCVTRSSGAVVRQEICRLIMQYGPWGCAVATASGEVLSSPQYAVACHVLGIPCRVFRLPDDDARDAREAFGRVYGAFSYDHIERKTWVQTYAQPKRLRSSTHDKSSLYELHVLPHFTDGQRLLDFGCGHGDYVGALARSGARAFGIEFYRRGPGHNRLNGSAIHKMIDEALTDLATHGRFDHVVIDNVITSIDTPQAEDDVLTCAAAFARPGGSVYVAGRRRERLDTLLRGTQMVENRRYVEFLDDHGFTAILRGDAGFFQRFHTDAEGVAIAKDVFGDASPAFTAGSNAWQFRCQKQREPDPDRVRAALRREFSLPWPEGRSVGRGEQAVEAWDAAMRHEECTRTGA